MTQVTQAAPLQFKAEISHLNSIQLVFVEETIEIINNTRWGIEAKIWERANGANLDHRCMPRNRSVSLETTKY